MIQIVHFKTLNSNNSVLLQQNIAIFSEKFLILIPFHVPPQPKKSIDPKSHTRIY